MSFNFMAAITICSDFWSPKEKRYSQSFKLSVYFSLRALGEGKPSISQMSQAIPNLAYFRTISSYSDFIY